MRNYEFTAIDFSNAIRRGLIKYWTSRLASRQLRKLRMTVVNVTAVPSAVRWSRLWQRPITRQDRMVLTRNLMTMQRAGLSLSESIAMCRSQQPNSGMQRILEEAERRLQSGQMLSVTLARHQRVFSPMYTAMIRVGERSGTLTEVFAFLTNYEENEQRLIRKLRHAMVYPALIIATMIVMVVMVMIFVIPKISQVYTEAAVSLPLYTRGLVAVSSFIVHYGWWLLGLSVGAAVLIRLIYLRLRRLQFAWHRVVLRLPLIGPIIKKVSLAVVSRSLAMLTKAGLSIDESLKLAAATATNLQYRRALERAHPFVVRGVRLADIFAGRTDLFLPVFQKMIMTGERTGNLDDMFFHVARYYDEEVEHWMANVSSLIEPALLLLTGLTVGSIAAAVLLPLWNFSTVL